MKLPKDVTVYGISGKAYRGEIPDTDCHAHHAEKFAPVKTPDKSPSNKKPDTVKVD